MCENPYNNTCKVTEGGYRSCRKFNITKRGTPLCRGTNPLYKELCGRANDNRVCPDFFMIILNYTIKS